MILLLFLSGLIMVGLGIIGYYLGNIYMEIQDRPALYRIRDLRRAEKILKAC